jgi:hypothetical protein
MLQFAIDRTLTPETGFFTESAGFNQYFREKTRFLATRASVLSKKLLLPP